MPIVKNKSSITIWIPQSWKVWEIHHDQVRLDVCYFSPIFGRPLLLFLRLLWRISFKSLLVTPSEPSWHQHLHFITKGQRYILLVSMATYWVLRVGTFCSNTHNRKFHCVQKSNKNTLQSWQSQSSLWNKIFKNPRPTEAVVLVLVLCWWIYIGHFTEYEKKETHSLCPQKQLII